MWERFARGPRVFYGHDGVCEALGLLTENLDHLRADPVEFIDVGDRVVVPIHLHGRVKGSSSEQAYDLVQVWTTHEKKAIRLDVYTRTEEALAALSAEGSAGAA